MSFIRNLSCVAALVTMTAAPAMAQDLDFALVNQSGFVLTEFYTSPADVNQWEDDVLGADVLPSGETASITVADGRTQCVYDLRMVFEDGDVLEDQVDMCEMGSYTIQ